MMMMMNSNRALCGTRNKQ